MRILLVAHGEPLEKMGGVGLLVSHLACELHGVGHEVHILVPRRSPRQTAIIKESKDWGTLHILRTQYFRWTDSWEDSASMLLLQSWLKQLRPEICHIHHLSGLPLNFRALLPKASKLIITLHDYAIPCARGQLYHREHGVCTSNSIDNCFDCLTPYRSARGAILRRLDKAKTLLSTADILLAPSMDLAKRIQSFYPRLTIKHIELPLLHHGISKRNTDTDFIFVGSIIPSKGLDLLLKALLRFPQTKTPTLNIIGFAADYPTWKNYAQYCQNLASLSTSIQWLGELNYADCLAAMSSAHCFVLPSIWPENSPLTIREARSMGLRVICSSWGGSSELISAQDLQLQRPSVSELYNLLEMALERDTGQIQTWPSIERYCKQLLGLYS